MSGAPLWPGPRLLVPITLDALVIGIPNQSNAWVDLTVDYAQLAQDGSATNPPFTVGNPPDTGVHLMWTLPAGLRQGQADDQGGLTFPLVPNRWLVLRSYVAAAGGAPQLTAWVVQSDYTGDDGTNPFPSPDGNAGTVTMIGKQFSLSGWTDTPTGAPFLRAVGPGDPAYAAVYANVGNVFGFHDDLGDAATGLYSYGVYGWYSPATADPLLGAATYPPAGFTTADQWTSLMNRFSFQVGDGSSAALVDAQQAWTAWKAAHDVDDSGLPPAQQSLAAQVLCHGVVFGISWQGTGHGYSQAIPTNDVTVAVGNTPVQALAAWLADAMSDPDAERLIEAFARGLVFTFTEDPVGFENVIHADGFAASYGGQEWVVSRRPQEDPSASRKAGDQVIELDPGTTQTLVTLNAQQRVLDAQATELAAQQWELFSDWWKLQRATSAPLVRQIQAAITDVRNAITALQKEQKQGTAERDRLLQQLILSLGPDWAVRPVEEPGYRQPNDPVVLVAGVHVDEKMARPGTLGDGMDSAWPPSRFTGQFVTGLDVTFEGSQAAVTSSVIGGAVSWPSGPGPLPKEADDLFAELILLDTSAAGFLAALFFKQAGVPNPTPQQLSDLTQLIARQQTAIWNATLDPRLPALALADAVGIVGTPPAQCAVQPWQAPWTPMYLDWQAEWHATSSTPDGQLAGWTFGEIDFAWNGTTVPPPLQTYFGRALLATQTAAGLAQSLQKFVDTSPDLDRLTDQQVQELRDAAGVIAGVDVVTQDLTGFTQQLLMRDSAIAGAVTDPDVATALGNSSTWVPNPVLPFTPLRSGHVLLNQLWVVDAFGQRLAATPKGVDVVPIRSETVVTPGSANAAYIQLPPRYSQPARLDFALLDATDDTVRSTSTAATSPVGGYLVPNHLDGSLTAYDASGQNLGALLPIQRDAGSGIRWDAVPGSSAPLGSQPAIGPDARHLGGIVAGLLKAGLQGSAALGDLVAVMDATEWATDPTGRQEEGNLEVLVGRPLAVVRATLAIEPSGQPAYDQGWQNTGKKVTDGYTKVLFPVRIGDLGIVENGVVGYFLCDDYSRFYAVYGYGARIAELRRALRQGVRSPDALRARLSAAVALDSGYVVTDGLVWLPADGTSVKLTVLTASRGAIPAVSGSLPVQQLSLPPGPITNALREMQVTFRVGPILADPQQLRMPLPAEIQGDWGWVARPDVTAWGDRSILEADATARMVERPLELAEGWLRLRGAFAPHQPEDSSDEIHSRRGRRGA